MDARNPHESRNRLATGIRAATLVIVLGTLATLWHPAHTGTTPATSSGATAATAAADMSVYFPDRFPAPQGPVEPLPAQF